MNSEILDMNPILVYGLASVLMGLAHAKHGIDVAKPVSMETFECLLNSNFTFAIVRIFQANGKVDPNAPARIRNARAAGIPHVSGYMIPCKKCGDPRGQVLDAVSNLQSQNANIEQIWLTIKDPEHWSLNTTENVQFIEDMVSEVRVQGAFPGIQTSQANWEAITNDTATGFKDLLLWLIQWDSKQNFDDFEPFGNWNMPAVKQYSEPTVICGVGVNKDWDPLEKSTWRLSSGIWSRIRM